MASRLRIAVSRLIVDDWRLLSTSEHDRAGTANEVAVAFALGWHLKPLVERRWDVDCEYNRATDAAGNADVKRRSDGGTVVYPDLLIHRRRQRGRDNNLLVLELKTNHASQTHRGGSESSVADLVEQHVYQHGVFLDLRLTGQSVDPHWSWYQPVRGAKGGSWSDTDPLYKQKALSALVTRAEAETAARYGVRI